MGFLSDVGGFISDPFGTGAISDATAQSVRGQEQAIEENRRQFDLTRSDNLPFLTQATDAGGSLSQLISGLEQAPQTPELQQFNFDPTEALNNPSLQFARDLGQQQLDRISGRNRNLGSGQRLIGAQQFGQGLASQFLPEEFNRQRSLNQTENNRLLSQFSLSNDRFNQRLNRLAGLVDVGRGTGSALGAFGANSSNNISNLLQGIGDTRASGTLGQSNAIQSGVGTAIGLGAFGLGGGFGALGGLFGGGGGGGGSGFLSAPSSVPGGVGNLNVGFNPTGLF